MYQELASTSFLQVTYRPESCLLIGRWLCSISEEQLREGYETLRLAALQHRCNHWLVDARRRVDRSRNAPEWIVNGFLPQVQRELGNRLCVAFLVLPNHLPAPADDASAAPKPDAPFQYARFVDEGAANAWLDKHRRGESPQAV